MHGSDPEEKRELHKKKREEKKTERERERDLAVLAVPRVPLLIFLSHPPDLRRLPVQAARREDILTSKWGCMVPESS